MQLEFTQTSLSPCICYNIQVLDMWLLRVGSVSNPLFSSMHVMSFHGWASRSGCRGHKSLMCSRRLRGRCLQRVLKTTTMKSLLCSNSRSGDEDLKCNFLINSAHALVLSFDPWDVKKHCSVLYEYSMICSCIMRTLLQSKTYSQYVGDALRNVHDMQVRTV